MPELCVHVVLWHILVALLPGAHGVSLLIDLCSQALEAAEQRAVPRKARFEFRPVLVVKVTVTMVGLASFIIYDWLQHTDLNDKLPGWKFLVDLPFDMCDCAHRALLHAAPVLDAPPRCAQQQSFSFAGHPPSVGEILTLYVGTLPLHVADIMKNKIVPRSIHRARTGPAEYLSLRAVCVLVKAEMRDFMHIQCTMPHLLCLLAACIP